MKTESLAPKTWTAFDVRLAILNGHVFYTFGGKPGARALVERFDCDCGTKTLRSEADATTDNNIDELPACN